MNREHVALRILYLLPEAFLSAPERVFLKCATFLIGVGFVLGVNSPGTVVSEIPRLIAYELAAIFMVGGIAGLFGIFKGNRPFERLGLSATAFGSICYAYALAETRGVGSIAGVIIFLFFALSCLVRLFVSSSAERLMARAMRGSL